MTLGPLRGARVLDLYAGSGALGIEALSRGARHAGFVESDPGARRVLARNLAALGLVDRATVWPHRLPGGLKRIEAALRETDLVLLDPPYGAAEARSTLAALGASAHLAAGTRVVAEHHAKDALPARTGSLERYDERRYGETIVSYYRAGERGTAADREEES